MFMTPFYSSAYVQIPKNSRKQPQLENATDYDFNNKCLVHIFDIFSIYIKMSDKVQVMMTYKQTESGLKTDDDQI